MYVYKHVHISFTTSSHLLTLIFPFNISTVNPKSMRDPKKRNKTNDDFVQPFFFGKCRCEMGCTVKELILSFCRINESRDRLL